MFSEWAVTHEKTLKADGVTDSERTLSVLCHRSFLSMWSYPSLFRDQGNAKGKGHGKELCDLLVVFGDDVLIFSDKYCGFPRTGKVEVDWRRWFKAAIYESAKQAWGAERWISQYPDRIFLDRACTRPFPYGFPNPESASFHRIVVAHNATGPCRDYFATENGSLRLDPTVHAEQHFDEAAKPFVIGDLDALRGFVHVIDDVSLNVLLSTLDTAPDFIAYLKKKEHFVRSGLLKWAAGEEHLLPYYYSNMTEDNEHDFIVPRQYEHVEIGDQAWPSFLASDQRRAQLEADKESYFWDYLIEKFAGHVFNGTSIRPTGSTFAHQEQLLRWLASENRLSRRVLSHAFLEILRTHKSSPGKRMARFLPPTKSGRPYYHFMLLAPFDGMDNGKYREWRRAVLQAQAYAIKSKNPEVTDIVGIATEFGDSEERSEDLIYVDVRNWTDAEQDDARETADALGLLTKLSEPFRGTFHEFPI